MKKFGFGLAIIALAMGLSPADVDAKGKRRHHRIFKHRHTYVAPVVKVHVSIDDQEMSVDVGDDHFATWTVSTGKDGYETPTGRFRAQHLAEEYYSRTYDDAPMPHSVFFSGGFAIHGTYHLRQLGRPASHGCIRLAPKHAAQLFALVQRYGMKRTRIVID